MIRAKIGKMRIVAMTMVLVSSLGVNSVVAQEINREDLVSSNENVNILFRETDYTLGAGDRLRLDIFQVEDYSGEYLVLVDGTISLPLVGSVLVEGLTIAQVSQVVSDKYAAFLRRPLVTVSLLSPRPLKIAISGEVNNPGSYTVDLQQMGQFPPAN